MAKEWKVTIPITATDAEIYVEANTEDEAIETALCLLSNDFFEWSPDEARAEAECTEDDEDEDDEDV